ncbi:hypothetical protein [Oceanicoccus sp. KOV_DT_Chl]|uniref:hypothetical protein n=1 Tax=Oceanicoccus sp. KOV_DT_Chl TaxID=1904639 RepID=UPI000C7B63DF|nr:hypothetical protein [Oceanicoccus sp. KOV_DT_Chl]
MLKKSILLIGLLSSAFTVDAALIDIGAQITSDDNSVTGSAIGTYNTDTSQILFASESIFVTQDYYGAITADVDITGTDGLINVTDCADLGGATNVCLEIWMNYWLDYEVLSNSVNTDGFGGITVSNYGAILTYNVAPVPVPAAAWLFSSALIGLAGLKRKK